MIFSDRDTSNMLPAILSSTKAPYLLARSTSSLLASLKKVHAIALTVALLCLPFVAESQQARSVSDSEVSSLLNEIESANRTRAIYTARDRRKIADISFDSAFDLVKRSGKWSTVRFKQPVVPAWVSADYVKLSGRVATVRANQLNMRLGASTSSPVLTQLANGYQSRVLARKNGFLKILAPSSVPFAIFAGSEEQASASRLTSAPRVISSPASERPLAQKPPFTQADDSRAQTAQTGSSDRASEQPQVLVSNESPQSLQERLHIIAPGDAISLLVFGEPDLSIENLRVPQSGAVSLPLIGATSVAGRTTAEVEKDVVERLSQGYVRNPRLSVTMFSYRPVFIRGAIEQTGSFPFSEGLTIGKAIALAGGSKKSAKPNGVSILRDGDIVSEGLSVDSFLEVKSGDVITIAEEKSFDEDGSSYIYLHGEVASPGEYKFRSGLTVEKAIVLAGGFTIRGSRKKISVTRYAGKDVNEEPERLKKVKLFTEIKPGDVINVGATWF